MFVVAILVSVAIYWILGNCHWRYSMRSTGNRCMMAEKRNADKLSVGHSSTLVASFFLCNLFPLSSSSSFDFIAAQLFFFAFRSCGSIERLLLSLNWVPSEGLKAEDTMPGALWPLFWQSLSSFWPFLQSANVLGRKWFWLHLQGRRKYRQSCRGPVKSDF